jgi:hypothetical protein
MDTRGTLLAAMSKDTSIPLLWALGLAKERLRSFKDRRLTYVNLHMDFIPQLTIAEGQPKLPIIS